MKEKKRHNSFQNSCSCISYYRNKAVKVEYFSYWISVFHDHFYCLNLTPFTLLIFFFFFTSIVLFSTHSFKNVLHGLDVLKFVQPPQLWLTKPLWSVLAYLSSFTHSYCQPANRKFLFSGNAHILSHWIRLKYYFLSRAPLSSDKFSLLSRNNCCCYHLLMT
jgi:hypothetical protein